VSLNNDKQKTLNVEGHKKKDSKEVFRKTKRHIRNASSLTGLHPVPFYRGEKLPGCGNHFGGSFPMSNNPAGLQTDILGRINGLDKVHIADSSIFPSISATTISLSVMANAHRIASHIVLE
jgi:choline dehydrogenase-like flavoprotein